jgi:hypothetical protein
MVVMGVVLARSGGNCLPEVDQRAAAPGGAQDALVFHFSCGLGRKGTSNVSVVPRGGAAGYPANLFSATDSTGMALFVSRADRPRVEVQWESDSVLTVRYAANARALLRMPAAFGVRAAYVEVSP